MLSSVGLSLQGSSRSLKRSNMAWLRDTWNRHRIPRVQIAWAALLLLLIPLRGSHPENAGIEYDHARQLFVHGSLEKCRIEAERGYRLHETSSPIWASKFQLQEAEAMVWGGMTEDALRLLSAKPLILIQDN